MPNKKKKNLRPMSSAKQRADERRKVFITVLSLTGNVSEAAKQAGINRNTAYAARDRFDDFAERWDEAIEISIDLLELEARRRGFEGVDEPVIYQGELMQIEGPEGSYGPLTIKKYSDRLLEVLLKAHRPEKYGDKVALTGSKGGPIQIEEVQWNVVSPQLKVVNS